MHHRRRSEHRQRTEYTWIHVLQTYGHYLREGNEGVDAFRKAVLPYILQYVNAADGPYFPQFLLHILEQCFKKLAESRSSNEYTWACCKQLVTERLGEMRHIYNELREYGLDGNEWPQEYNTELDSFYLHRFKSPPSFILLQQRLQAYSMRRLPDGYLGLRNFLQEIDSQPEWIGFVIEQAESSRSRLLPEGRYDVVLTHVAYHYNFVRYGKRALKLGIREFFDRYNNHEYDLIPLRRNDGLPSAREHRPSRPVEPQSIRDYYAILGIDINASAHDVRRAYRHLSMRYHPDRLARMSTEEQERGARIMQALNEARMVLGDEEQRRAYNYRYVRTFPQSR